MLVLLGTAVYSSKEVITPPFLKTLHINMHVVRHVGVYGQGITTNLVWISSKWVQVGLSLLRCLGCLHARRCTQSMKLGMQLTRLAVRLCSECAVTRHGSRRTLGLTDVKLAGCSAVRPRLTLSRAHATATSCTLTIAC